jgi:DNA-binding SARP family transcriptional activator
MARGERVDAVAASAFEATWSEQIAGASVGAGKGPTSGSVERTGHRQRIGMRRGSGPGVKHGLRIALLGGFELFDRGGHVSVSEGSERLLAFVALRGHPDRRIVVAGTLWPEVSERRSYASLRSTLARMDPVSRSALQVDSLLVSLDGGVTVDLRAAQALAYRLLNPAARPGEPDLTPAALASLSADLLPGWYDDWVLLEAEDWRQLRLHALEALAGVLTGGRRFGDATAAAQAAIRAEPLRESAHAALIRIHLAEGNQSEALREFDRYGRLLQAELGLQPTPQLRELVAGLLGRRHARVTPAG